MRDDNKIYTKSIKCIAYITYKTNQVADVVADKNGLNVFSIEDNSYTKLAYDDYKTITQERLPMILDVNKYDDIIKKYKKRCNNFNRKE